MKCNFCQMIGTHDLLESGAWTQLKTECAGTREMIIYMEGVTGAYYPRYCPECGRRINYEIRESLVEPYDPLYVKLWRDLKEGKKHEDNTL